MDRRLFSKIMSNLDYKPSKDSALALAIALELTLNQTNDLLSRAGYTLSHSDKRDVIIEYFIREGSFDEELLKALVIVQQIGEVYSQTKLDVLSE